MPKTAQDCWRIAWELAEFYQRQLNKQLGVGVAADVHARRRASKKTETEQIIDIAMLKAKRDVCGLLARRFKHGRQRLRKNGGGKKR